MQNHGSDMYSIRKLKKQDSVSTRLKQHMSQMIMKQKRDYVKGKRA